MMRLLMTFALAASLALLASVPAFASETSCPAPKGSPTTANQVAINGSNISQYPDDPRAAAADVNGDSFICVVFVRGSTVPIAFFDNTVPPVKP